MTLNDKITVFINRAQTRIAGLAHEVALDLDEAYHDRSDVNLAIELVDVVTCLQDELLDWSTYEIEMVIDFYTVKAELNDIAIVNFEDKFTYVSGDGTSGSGPGYDSWQPVTEALNNKIDANHSYVLDEIDRLDLRIDGLDFSNLIPQEVLDEIEANSNARHEHSNKDVLDNVTQQKLDDIASNKAHTEDGTVHVTNAQKEDWNDKPTQAELTQGLAGKSNTGHVHEMEDINGLQEAFDGLTPEKGDKGDKGDTPFLEAGTAVHVDSDDPLVVSMDNTNPLNPKIDFQIPKGRDGEDFEINVFGPATDRLDSQYDQEGDGETFTYLGLDDGYMYFRRYSDDQGTFIPASSTSGWVSTRFMGNSGWSPVHGLIVEDNDTTVMTLNGWTGGTGEPPVLGTPGVPIYLGPNGYTQFISEAINVKGQTGLAGPTGKAVFPDAAGVLSERDQYDDQAKDYMFLDSEAGMMYIKRSDDSADWSVGYQWRGDQGPQGEQGEQGLPGEGGGQEWDIVSVSADVNPASPFTYYEIDGTAAPVSVYLPDPVADNTDEFSIALHQDTHKVTITTVGGIAGAIDGSTSIVIPNVSGRVVLKCNGSSGYVLINDTRNMKTIVNIDADRDFAVDGFEHMSSYKVTPSPAGSAVLITLPAPNTFDKEKSVKASFTLSGPGSFTVVRADSGMIGKSPQQVVGTVGATITIEEGEGLYSIIQDSRPSNSAILEFPAYRLDDVSDIGGIYNSLALSKDDPRYGAELELITDPILDGVATNYVNYITDIGVELGSLPASNVVFSVTTKLTSAFNRNVVAYYELYKRDQAGTETLLTTSPSFIITQTIYSQFNIIAQLPATTFLSTDRLVQKVWIQKSADGQNDPTLTTKIEGDNGAFFSIQLPSTEARHNVLQGRSDASQHPATSIDFDNSSNGFQATTVQKAIEEAGASPSKYDLKEDDGDLVSGEWFMVDTGLSGVITLNLPSSPNQGNFVRMQVARVSGANGSIQGNGETIDGNASFEINTDTVGQIIEFVYGISEWSGNVLNSEGGGSAFPEWALNDPTLTWDGSEINPDLAVSDVDEYSIAVTTTSIVIGAPSNVDTTKGRKKYVVIDNSLNTSAISTISFDPSYVFPIGTKPTGMAIGEIATFEIFNNKNAIRVDWSKDE